MRTKAIVTGGTGFIGSNLINELLKREWEVYALVRKNSSVGYERLGNYKNINYIYSEDLFKGNCYNYKLPQIDICFHLAAYGVDYKQDNLDELIDGNIKFTMKLLEFCKGKKIKKVINTGSCFEYGMNREIKLNEEDRLNPKSNYSIIKTICEKMAKFYCKSNNINMITVRPFGVFGENEGLHRFVPQLMKAVIKNEGIKMTNGYQIKDYLYINDLVDAYIELALTDVPLYEAYNICSGREVRIKDIALELAKITDCRLDIFELGAIPYRVGELMYCVGDNTKIKKYTNWKPKYSLSEGLKRTYKWYKINLEDLV
jgi:nucleoside-diphosphate-sugar epimerase